MKDSRAIDDTNQQIAELSILIEKCQEDIDKDTVNFQCVSTRLGSQQFGFNLNSKLELLNNNKGA